MRFAALALSLLVIATPLAGQEFAGTFTTTNDAGKLVTLKLDRAADGSYAGTLRTDEVTFQLQGNLSDTLLFGAMTGDGAALYFAAALAEPELSFYVIEPDANAQPNFETATGFTMTRGGEAANPRTPAPAAQTGAESGRLGDKYAGYFFRAPAGWKAQQSLDGVLLGHDAIPGFILVQPHQASNLQQLQAEAMQGIQEQALQLAVTGMPQPFGSNGLQAEYQGLLQGQSVKAYAIGLLSPHGGGIAIVALTETAKLGTQHKNAIEELARSVVFRQPEGSPATQSWDTELRGRKLVHMDSYYSGPSVGGGVGGGYSSETTIALCSSGEFGYWDSSTVGASGAGVSGYSAGRGGAQGKWQIVTRGGESVLVLSGTDGTVREYTLSWRDRLVHLNGNKFFRTENDVCR